MERPLLVLSDTHVSRDYGKDVGRDLGALLAQHRDAELVLAGDILDLSLENSDVPVEDGLESALAPHHGLKAALSEHLRGGAPITLVPGNHDAGLDDAHQAAQLKRLLRVENDSQLSVNSWFLRRGGVHIEHGHLYDPDCAPNHPLARPNATSEGLGTALMRRFVSPHDATFFAHANATTPLSGLLTAIEKWGLRSPYVIADYFRTAAALCFEAARNKPLVQEEKEQGQARLSEYAASRGVETPRLEQLLRQAPLPTHHSFRATFQRLYFDRIFAGCALAAGAGLLASAGLGSAVGATALLSSSGSLTGSGALLSATGGAYLIQSRNNRKRYGHSVVGQLESAAARVKESTDCDLVVFGHTHVEVDEPAYVNLGSFGFARAARPYLLVATDGSHQRGHF